MVLGTAGIRALRRAIDVTLVALIAVVLATMLVARIVPPLTGGEVLVVAGGSMEPAIGMGAAILAVPVQAATLRPGDVVSLRVGPGRAIFTHRVTRVVTRADGTWLATRGDANPRPDPSLVPAATVIGRVAWTVPYAGYAIALLGSVTGIVCAMALAASLAAAAWILEGVESDRRAAGRPVDGALSPGMAG